MDNSNSCIIKVYKIIVTSFSFFVSTSIDPIFMDLVLPFNWEENELKGMSHEMLALLEEYAPFSKTSIVASIVWFAHMP